MLIRCDLNVPLKDGVIGDDTRIRASVPTVKYLLDKGEGAVLKNHSTDARHRSTPVEESMTLRRLGLDVLAPGPPQGGPRGEVLA